MTKILCVAEKPSISKAVAGHLSGGQYQTVRLPQYTLYLGSLAVANPLQHNTRSQYIKNYAFTFDFGPPYGSCEVTMTCVTGHMTAVELSPDFKDWKHPPPDRLFDAPVQTVVPDVRGGSEVYALIPLI